MRSRGLYLLYRVKLFLDRVVDATNLFHQHFNDMAITKGEEKGESSTSAAKKVLKANTNGVANYELPW